MACQMFVDFHFRSEITITKITDPWKNVEPETKYSIKIKWSGLIIMWIFIKFTLLIKMSFSDAPSFTLWAYIYNTIQLSLLFN